MVTDPLFQKRKLKGTPGDMYGVRITAAFGIAGNIVENQTLFAGSVILEKVYNLAWVTDPGQQIALVSRSTASLLQGI